MEVVTPNNTEVDMQRVYNAGPAVDKYCEETGEGNTHWDLCDCCCSTLSEDIVPATIGLHAELGDPAGTGLDLGNPPPDLDDNWLYSNDYRCYLCDTPLWDEDKVLPI